MTLPKIERMIRLGLPQVGVAPYGQIHLHSTANPYSTAEGEASYMNTKDLNSGFYTDVVGNGRIIQTAEHNRGAWDVGNTFNEWGYASIELIESHKTKEEFLRDYKIYVEYARHLAKEAGIPIVLDEGELGIMTHRYCTDYWKTQGGHIDPYPYLAKWGISRSQFKKDVENGFEDTGKKGWVKENDYWRFYEDNVPFKDGWKKIGGKWYLFDKNGAMYADTWAKRDGKWFYMDNSGAMVTGWRIINGRYYKLDKSGAMLEGWYKESNTWYYLDASGAMKTGWLKDKAGNWYYLSKPNGAMVTGTVPIDGKT